MIHRLVAGRMRQPANEICFEAFGCPRCKSLCVCDVVFQAMGEIRCVICVFDYVRLMFYVFQIDHLDCFRNVFLNFRVPRHLLLCPELSIVTMYSVQQQMAGQGPQFPFPMQGVQSTFQPLHLGNNPLAAFAAHRAPQSPPGSTHTQTQPIQESTGAQTQYSTGSGVCYLWLPDR